MRKYFIIIMGAVIAPLFFSEALAQPRGEKTHEKVAQLDGEAAAESWSKFSHSGIACDYVMEFVVSHNPRRGESVKYDGVIFGKKADAFGREKMRVKIRKSGAENGAEKSDERDWLFLWSKDGAEVWTLENSSPKKLDEKDWAGAICSGLIISPFDFLMPFKTWDAKYVGSGRIGQAVHFFELSPKEGEAAAKGIYKAEVALTREFNSPSQVKTFAKNADGKNVERTLSLSAVKKIDGFWTMLEFELLDGTSRDRDSLRFTSARMRAKIDDAVFEPKSLGKTSEKPLMERL